MQFELKQLWADFEIAGRLYCQTIALNVPNLLGPKKDEFWSNLFACMHKHTAIRCHLANYKSREAKAFVEARRAFRRQPNQTKEAFPLIFELEAFLFQVKSSLDMVVKILDQIVGRDFVSTRTYGSDGDGVIKGLEGYKKKGNVNIPAVERLIELIRADKTSWVKTVVQWRDEICHYEGLQNHRFVSQEVSPNRFEPVAPKFKNQEVVPLLEMIMRNNLEFQQDFLAFSSALLFLPGITLGPANPEQSIRDFGAKAGKFIKYAAYLDPASVQQPASSTI